MCDNGRATLVVVGVIVVVTLLWTLVARLLGG